MKPFARTTEWVLCEDENGMATATFLDEEGREHVVPVTGPDRKKQLTAAEAREMLQPKTPMLSMGYNQSVLRDSTTPLLYEAVPESEEDKRE